ncbi:RNA-binding protein 44 isoform X1 [Pseudochaenichthys georgianus]|uniref:RNA-binding protein 44 isoform X1 n=1 Tax=Pseudochaenichthys georgianus TaxID=52239 RepID=UPI00146E48A4|nr:RNA-binding protein 44 isoform X3 [Pseudochaenichthys georgianus]
MTRQQTLGGCPLYQVMLPYWNLVIEKTYPIVHRIFHLNRSIFELVESHNYLELTDQRLLHWYLSLNFEDRKIIQDEGGLHWFLVKHPALELSPQHVYVKHCHSVIPALPTMTSSRPTHVSPSTSATARTDLEMLPNVRDPLSHLGDSSSGDGSEKRQHEETLRTEPLLHTQESYQAAFSKLYSQEATYQRESSHLYEQRPSRPMSSSLAVCKVPADLANLSLDMDLERRSRPWGEPEPKSQMSLSQGPSAHDTHAGVSPSQSEWPNIEKASPDCYSVSVQMDGTEYTDRSVIQSDGQAIPPLVEESSTNEGCFEDQSNIFHSIMENDESILSYETSRDMKAHNDGLHSVDGEALAASSDTWKTAEKHISSPPRVTTCDVMVGPERPLCTSADTQTTGPEAADKHINTEVHMVDLDSLVKAFTKLKGREKSLACKLRKEREYSRRADLSFLALQYSMCRQHCSTLNESSAEGGLLAPQNPHPAHIATVLQQLECDYKAMRDQILAGVPLEQLKPLSVDSEKTTTSYIPAQMVADVPSGSSQELQKHDSSPTEDTACPDDQIRSECQQSNNEEKHMKKENSAAVAQDRDAAHNAHKPEEKQTPAACKDVSTLEAWFDAEEDLQPAAAAAETEPDPTVIPTDQTSESSSKEVESSVLYVSNLPSNASECDVMQWFEKYHASEVSISALKNDLRVAIVMISGAQSAEAAVRELNGSSMHGHALHVEHINRARDETQDQASGTVRGPESAPTQTSKSDSSSADRKLISQPPLSSRRVVCVSPTLKGTMVQENYCTMGGFNTLMTELTQRHQGVSRQRFVDALLQLKAKHKGVLCGLPLRTIREMTSDLITGPESATQQ